MTDTFLKKLPFPLGTVIRHKQFKGRFSKRLKPRYLIYFGKLDEIKVHVFFTTTTQVNYYREGSRKSVPYHLFPEKHPCFTKECVLDVQVAYLIPESEIEKLKSRVEIKGRLSVEEFKQCLRAITYTDLYLDRVVYNYLRNLLFSL